MADRKIFRGVGVVVVGVEDHRKLKVVSWLSDDKPIDFKAATPFPVDLGTMPTRAQAPGGVGWDKVTVDDHGIDKNGEPLPTALSIVDLEGYHVTTIGGFNGFELDDNIGFGIFAGGVYLEDDEFAKHRQAIDKPVKWPAKFRTYELTTIHYKRDAGKPGPRYAGFHGTIVDKATSPGGIFKVELSLPGKPGKLMGSWWFNLNDATECDGKPVVDAAAGEKALTPASNVGDEGAIFIELRRVDVLQLQTPKLPIGLDL